MSTKFYEDCLAINLPLQQNISLADKCSFKTGGRAEFFIAPSTEQEVEKILSLAHTHQVPVITFGGGTNILPPDDTLKGLTLCLSMLVSDFTGLHSLQENKISCLAGSTVRALCNKLANIGKRGPDFMYAMPGTIGGAVWMNARCYGKEISDILIEARGYNIQGAPWIYRMNKADFSYKKSPFQNDKEKFTVITSVTLAIEDDEREAIWTDMLSHEIDRYHKGHFIAPCAGSVFKNDYSFGKASGEILDELNWKGKSLGAAQVNPYHANIIINPGHAKALDIRMLGDRMKDSVKKEKNIALEYELLFLGEETQWKK